MPRYHQPAAVLGDLTLPPPPVVSVEYVEDYFNLSATQENYNLTKGQDPDNCVPFISPMSVYYNQSNVRSAPHMIYADIVDSGGTAQLQWKRGAADATYIPLNLVASVIEFDSASVRVQKISWSLTASETSKNVTVPITYNHTRTFFLNYYTHGTSTTQNIVQAHSDIRTGINDGGTWFTVARSVANGPIEGVCYVVEDITADNSVFRTSRYYQTPNAVGNFDAALNYTVNLSKTFLLCSVLCDRVAWDPDSRPVIPTLLDANTLRLNIPAMSTINTLQCTTQVIEWLDDTEVERGTYNYTSPTTGAGGVNYQSVGSIVTGRSRDTCVVTPALMHSHHNSAVHNNNSWQQHECNHWLRPHVSNEQVELAYRNSGAAIEKTVTWQAIFFPGLVP